MVRHFESQNVVQYWSSGETGVLCLMSEASYINNWSAFGLQETLNIPHMILLIYSQVKTTLADYRDETFPSFRFEVWQIPHVHFDLQA